MRPLRKSYDVDCDRANELKRDMFSFNKLHLFFYLFALVVNTLISRRVVVVEVAEGWLRLDIIGVVVPSDFGGQFGVSLRGLSRGHSGDVGNGRRD